MPKVELEHPDINSGNPIRIACKRVNVQFNKNLETKPEANNWALREVQDLSAENVIYTIEGFIYNSDSAMFDYKDLKSLYKAQYSGSNPINLYIEKDDGNALISGITDNYPIKTIVSNIENVSWDITSDKNLEKSTIALSLIETK